MSPTRTASSCAILLPPFPRRSMRRLIARCVHAHTRSSAWLLANDYRVDFRASTGEPTVKKRNPASMTYKKRTQTIPSVRHAAKIEIQDSTRCPVRCLTFKAGRGSKLGNKTLFYMKRSFPSNDRNKSNEKTYQQHKRILSHLTLHKK